MTQFEYISVAIALICSTVVARLLGGIAPATRSDRSYWIHLCWVAQGLLVIVVLWAGFWNLRIVEWTPIRFIYALLVPSFNYVAASILVGSPPESVVSFRDHFYDSRIRFFSVLTAGAVLGALMPIVNGTPTAQLLRSLPFSLTLVAVYVAGLIFRGERAHGALSIVVLLINGTTLMLMPAVSS